MLVLDASVCAPWFLPDEYAAVSDRARDELRSNGAVVPSLWSFEMRNILLVASRRKRILSTALPEALTKVATIRVLVDSDLDWSRVVELAIDHHLTIYDASYLELAQRLDLKLATLDRRLAEAARAVGVPLLV